MKVYVERTDVYGQVDVYKNVQRVTEKETAYELYIHENWQIIAAKDNHRIFKVEDGQTERNFIDGGVATTDTHERIAVGIVTRQDAIDIIKKYEEEDKKNGCYQRGSYGIYKTEFERIITED